MIRGIISESRPPLRSAASRSIIGGPSTGEPPTAVDVASKGGKAPGMTYRSLRERPVSRGNPRGQELLMAASIGRPRPPLGYPAPNQTAIGKRETAARNSVKPVAFGTPDA